MLSFSAGSLRHSVLLEQRVQSTGPGMDLRSTYTPVGTAWAEIEGVGGAMYLDSVQVEERMTHRLAIRFRARTDFDHISKGTQRYRVRNIRDPFGTRRWLQIEAEEITPGPDTP